MVQASIGWNAFQFPEIFRTLQEMGVDDWIERNRLTIGLSESDRRVDHVAASLMRSQCQLNALQQTVVDIQSANAESARQHAESARQHTEVARQHARTATTVTELSGYNINRNRQIEEDVSSALKTSLQSSGYSDFSEMPPTYRRVKRSDGSAEVEWDGVIACSRNGENVLFLIEAKHFLQSDHVQSMRKRLNKTRSFVESISAPGQSMMGKPNKYKSQCAQWGLYRHFKMQGVIGGPCILDSLKQDAIREGYLCVRMEGLKYEVTSAESISS